MIRQFSQSTAIEGGAVTIPSGAVADVAGNTNPGIMSAPYKIDLTPPVMQHDATKDSYSLPGNNGWCRGTATAGFSASDATSGLANPSQSSFTMSPAGEGTAVAIASGSVTDVAGNTNPGISVSFTIDHTPPTVSCSVTPNAIWPPNHTMLPVQATVTVNDTLSGPQGFTLVAVTSNEPTAANDI
ncbi:MAG: hypothetical protein NVS4B8_26260 [Herpetosiphon sp.]